MVSNVLSRILIWAVPVLFSIVIHEVAHGWMAYKLGDNTAKDMGRLTLNPLVHVDVMGTLILPLIMIVMGGPVFGWAKPVPFNPYNFNPRVDRRNGTMWVAVSGPASNFILAFIASFVLVISQRFLSGLPALLYMSIFQLYTKHCIRQSFCNCSILLYCWLFCHYAIDFLLVPFFIKPSY